MVRYGANGAGRPFSLSYSSSFYRLNGVPWQDFSWYWPTSCQRGRNGAASLLGPYGAVAKGSIGAVEGGRWMTRTIAARGLTIAAGSSEIQHNIIGERVLKLPKG